MIAIHAIHKPDEKSISTWIIPILKNSDFSFDEALADYHDSPLSAIIAALRTRDCGHDIARIGDACTPALIILTEDNNQYVLNKKMLDWLYEQRHHIAGNVGIDFRFIHASLRSKLAYALCRSIGLLDHKTDMYKSDKKHASKGQEITAIYLLDTDKTFQTKIQELNNLIIATDTMKTYMRLVNSPANKKTPEIMADQLRQSGTQYGYDVEILEIDQLKELSFGALLAVNQGSHHTAKCLVATYTPTDANYHQTVALVGKGVTFDTGGISLKPSSNMAYMKSDMGGAAAVMGAIELAARLQLPVRVHAVIPCTDNSIGSTAIKPGDIVTSYNGSTIEIIDTDAEGRLILADALAYANQRFQPDVMIDLATLTGSVVRALGPLCAGLMTQNDGLAQSLESAGMYCGERLWRLPMWCEYGQMMQSDTADIKNLSDKPIAGSITAAKFLEHFIDNHPSWAHIDIAGTAFGTTPFGKSYNATGYGILLLNTYLEHLTKLSDS